MVESNDNSIAKVDNQSTEINEDVTINIKHIGNVNVKGELVKSVKSLFRSAKDKDVKARQQLTYDLF
ncbi:hypothetical protein BK141_29330 [Paenibacillus sp. FSL R5-0765]|nr:hypothetical protein BK141_29330 [Paenibacillus sp. FSL R5-0765]